MTTGTVQAAATDGSDLWARVFAALYDPFLWVGERVAMAALRQELLARARGRTVELGSGTGLNLRYYPDDLEELILTEPEAAMRARLAYRLNRTRRRGRVLDASAERLPFADGTVDTVVSTLVLCTVEAPDLALQEIRRVLRPGGRLLFLEHVRSESPWLARWQDRLAALWRRFAEGCRCNRATVELIRACGLELGDLQEASWRAMPLIVRPLMVGVATKSDECEPATERGSAAGDPRSCRRGGRRPRRRQFSLSEWDPRTQTSGGAEGRQETHHPT